MGGWADRLVQFSFSLSPFFHTHITTRTSDSNTLHTHANPLLNTPGDRSMMRHGCRLLVDAAKRGSAVLPALLAHYKLQPLTACLEALGPALQPEDAVGKVEVAAVAAGVAAATAQAGGRWLWRVGARVGVCVMCSLCFEGRWACMRAPGRVDE